VKAGCHPKLRQDVAVRLLIHEKTASLLAVSAPGCRQAAPDRLAQRRSIQKSGRRDSNPRQPAWKAGGHVLAARLVYIGFPAGFTWSTCNVSVPDKRCCVRFFHHSAKNVACFCPLSRQKRLRSLVGRRSHCCPNYTSDLRSWQCGIGKKFYPSTFTFRLRTDILR
jgi:hypothetical protein